MTQREPNNLEELRGLHVGAFVRSTETYSYEYLSRVPDLDGNYYEEDEVGQFSDQHACLLLEVAKLRTETYPETLQTWYRLLVVRHGRDALVGWTNTTCLIAL